MCLDQVSREAGVDCALAELYTKSLAIEGTIQEQKHAEVLTKLYVRMNEVIQRCNLPNFLKFLCSQKLVGRDAQQSQCSIAYYSRLCHGLITAPNVLC